MAAHDYSEFPEKKSLANKHKGAPTHAEGSSYGRGFVEKPGPWKGAGGPTQKRDRSLGIRRLKIYPKSDGL